MPIKKLLKKAVEEKASDLHLRADRPPRVRIDGQLYDISGYVPTEEDLKDFFYKLMTPEQIRRFETTHELDFSYSFPELCRVRVNLFVQRGNFASAIRIFPDRIPTMEEINLPKICYNFVNLNRGLVLVTGPSGCGKSTTLAAMINFINEHRRCHILTIEDPIEYVFTDKLATISQREIRIDTLSFQAALRHALRQDPDVIMIGEMRDLETMQAAITLAETGHLTFSTLHTGEASQTVNRIIDSFPPHQQAQIRAQLSVSLEGIISQRLVPLKGKRGRIAAHEVMVCTPGIKNLIREGKVPQIASAIQTGLEDGMITMNHSLGTLLKQGLISYEAALNTSWDKKGFAAKYS
ncbi:type IV pilus twitching motility protein PilT [Candidatus Sumerlaeota bacterium]|nr:type IV pilus twitching motility protein PilT [Candidatus Sumerlaeota bacterium]